MTFIIIYDIFDFTIIKPNIDPKIFKKYGVKIAYLFGSRAKDFAAPGSDFDIGVLFKEDGSDLLDKSMPLSQFKGDKKTIKVSERCIQLSIQGLLVHEYTKIDPVLIHQNLQRLEDFREFSRYILKYIDK